jgi:hypothetical protein
MSRKGSYTKKLHGMKKNGAVLDMKLKTECMLKKNLHRELKTSMK